MAIQRVDSIDLDGTMTLTLTIIMVWKDPRLIFLNIKDNGLVDGDENIKDISLAKQEQLWLPLDKIVHTNAVIGEIDEAPTSYVRVVAQSGPLENDGTEDMEDVRYDGGANSLVMARDYRLQYRCTFYFFQYPFDKQECDGTILLPWKNNYTVALTTGRNPIKILGEK